jgi:hypothetical protein
MRHVQLMRDVYYTSPRLDTPPVSPAGAIAELLDVRRGDRGWGTTDNPITLRGNPSQQTDLDEFFVLGDNSPISLDSRLWVEAGPTLLLWKDPKGPHSAANIQYKLGTVPRYSMIGKAMFVYWPAGYRLFGGVPIVPNVGRMRLIR